MSYGFWFSEGPQVLAGTGVDRYDLPPRCCDGIEGLVDINRCRAGKVVEIRPGNCHCAKSKPAPVLQNCLR